MIHHVSLGMNDKEKSKRFYVPVLEAIGFRLISEDESSLDFGTSVMLFSLEKPTDGNKATAGNGTHIAFSVESRKNVEEFHRAGIENGGRDAGKPGPRPKYDDHYYGAFLFDPDGNKIEAVTFSSR